MAKQVINIGTMADNKSGDPLRTAFTKINENFTELYNRPTGGTDLSAVTQSIIPDTDITHDLGSPTKRFRDLYLSGNTIDLGGTLISADQNGNVSIPGLTQSGYYPYGIIDYRDQINPNYLDFQIVNPLDYMIIDQVTWQFITNSSYFAFRGDYVPPEYEFTLDQNSRISNIILIQNQTAYPAAIEDELAAVNTDNLYLVPYVARVNGFPDYATLETVLQGYNLGVINAGVASERLVQPITPQLDISDLTDAQGVLNNHINTSISVSGGIDNMSTTPIDLTKSINKLTAGYYTLANGTEGQILHVVRQTGLQNSDITRIYVTNKCRIAGSEYTNNYIEPFVNGADVVTFIYTDDAWQSIGGQWD